MVFKRGGDEARAMPATLNLGKLVKFEKVIATQQSEPSVGASEADPNGVAQIAGTIVLFVAGYIVFSARR
jgi:hypothetical protein